MSIIPTPPQAPWTAPFWKAAQEGVLLIQQCPSCIHHIFYPRRHCPYCGAPKVNWVQASGRGTVYSFTVVENNAPSAFLEQMPFIIAIIQLEEGVRMMSALVACDPADARCEMPVEVTFERVSGELSLPKFKPAGAAWKKGAVDA